MILAVDEVGYADAVAAFRGGNHAAAAVVSQLAAGLAGTGSMAGTDTGAAEFAAAYDRAAGTTLHALADATRALATLGQTTAACDSRHRDSERAALTPSVIVDPGCAPPPDDSWLAPRPATPPSPLGGDSPVLSAEENWILDHVGGVLWPDGHPERLRSAAAAWRRAGESVLGLASCCDTAGDALATQRSPEIPLALAATDDLRRVLLDLASECSSLAAQCDGHATAIESAHAALRALLSEVLTMVVEGVVVSAVLGAVSLGAATAAGTAAVAARVATTAPRFHRIISALRTAQTGYATALRATHTTAAAARARLTRFLHVPVRGERGAIRVLPGRPPRPTGWLRAHEHSGSHTLEKHVGRTVEQLRERTPMPIRASSFTTQADAERILDHVLRRHQQHIDDWLATTKGHLRLEDSLPYETGISALRDGPASTVTGVRVILRRDATMPEGFRIHTAFPQP